MTRCDYCQRECPLSNMAFAASRLMCPTCFRHYQSASAAPVPPPEPGQGITWRKQAWGVALAVPFLVGVIITPYVLCLVPVVVLTAMLYHVSRYALGKLSTYRRRRHQSTGG